MASKKYELTVSKTASASNKGKVLGSPFVNGLSDEEKLAAKLGKKVVFKDGDDWMVVVYRIGGSGHGVYLWKQATGGLLRQLIETTAAER
jgi:hypothetical protein